MIKKTVEGIIALILTLGILLSSLVSCSGGKNEREPAIYYHLFDTVSVITSYEKDSDEEYERRCNAVADLLFEYHKLFDIYYEYSGINNLFTINKQAGISAVEVDDRLIDFLLYAKEMYTLTNGEMNIAMGSVLRLWQDCREAAENSPSSARIPTEEELARAAQHTDIDNLIIDEDAGTVYLADPEMSLDVGALGKGYATAKAAELLVDMGATSYVLNIGGNLVFVGEKPGGKPWNTAIANPRGDGYYANLMLKNTSCVTSGDYERFFTVNEERYHHIIDRDTLFPARYFSSVTVISADGALADALSTALFCMTKDEGEALATRLGIEVYWIYPDGTSEYTEGIAELLVK